MKSKKLFFVLWVLVFSVQMGQAQTMAFFKTLEKGNSSVINEDKRQLFYNNYDTVLSNRHIEKASVDKDEKGYITISVKLTSDGTSRFAEATKSSIGKPILIMYNDQLLSAPNVLSEINTGELTITGSFTLLKAKEIAEKINGGKVSVFSNDVLIQPSLQLEKALVNSNYIVLDSLLHKDLLMGHSNAYFQSKEDVIKDLKSKKITYESIEQLGTQNVDKQQQSIRVSRFVFVKGKYMGTPFSMKLALMEVWIENRNIWQLWSRQAVKINE